MSGAFRWLGVILIGLGGAALSATWADATDHHSFQAMVAICVTIGCLAVAGLGAIAAAVDLAQDEA